MDDYALSRREVMLASMMGIAMLGSEMALMRTAQAHVQDKAKDTEIDEKARKSSGFMARNDSADITVDDIARAEKILGVSYSDAERQQMIEAIGGQIDAMQMSRTMPHPNGLAPAINFDPRMPGNSYDHLNDGPIHTAALVPESPPANETDLAFAPLTHLAKWMKEGKISSARLTQIYLKRIEKYNDVLHAFITPTPELALQQAEKADADLAAGTYHGPLHGIPYALKDLVDTDGIRTTWGAAPYRDRVASRDGAVYEKLRDAGAVLLGKASCGALAYGDLWFDHRTRNPWHTEEGSSGSSAGSASSTAAGLCGFSIGTETLGSIISPSNRCGLAGLRPTFGRVSRFGAMALSWSLDKIGPITRRVEDTALVLSVINDFDARDAGSIDIGFGYNGNKPLGDMKIGYYPALFDSDQATDVDRHVLETAKSLGLNLVAMTLPDIDTSQLFRIIRIEAAAAFEDLTLSGRDEILVGQEDRDRPNMFRMARFFSAIDFINMDRSRRLLMQEMDHQFDGIDAIIGPNYAGGMLTITNFTGHPQMTFKAGFFDSANRTLSRQEQENAPKVRVPQNFSVWAPLYEDANAIRVAAVLENALGIADSRPEGFDG